MTPETLKPESDVPKSKPVSLSEKQMLGAVMLPNPHEFHVPDTVHTAAVRELTKLLAPHGNVVMAGGAARDMWHFNPPRDLDLWVLGYLPDVEAYGVLSTTAGVTDLVLCSSSGESDVSRQNLDYVIKFKYMGLNFDLIQHGNNPVGISAVCMTFDVTLNQAWLDVSTEYNVVRTAPMYPSISEGLPVRLVKPYACTKDRLAYIQKKYPNYWYQINPEELL